MKRTNLCIARVCLALAAFVLSPLVVAQAYVALNFDTLFYDQPNVETAGLGPEDPPLIIITPIGDFERAPEFRDLDLTLQSLRFKYGYSIFSWLAVEARAGFGVSKQTLKDFRELPQGATAIDIPNPDFGQPGEPPFLPDPGAEVTIRQGDAEISLRRHFGAYVRLGGNFDSLVSPYLVWGRSKGVFEVTANSGTGGGRTNSASYGLGFNIRLTDRAYLNLEYMDLFDTKEIDVENWSGGFEYRF